MPALCAPSAAGVVPNQRPAAAEVLLGRLHARFCDLFAALALVGVWLFGVLCILCAVTHVHATVCGCELWDAEGSAGCCWKGVGMAGQAAGGTCPSDCSSHGCLFPASALLCLMPSSTNQQGASCCRMGAW
jgi:hypothetical protein